MSVISRMLRDLEARKAQPGAASDSRTLKPDPARPCGRTRRRGASQRRIALVLAVLLIAVAAALWWQRAPELRAGLAQAVDRAGTQWDAWRAGPAGSGEGTAVVTQAEPESERQPDRPPARLLAARFTGAGDEAALELRVEGEPRGEPGYARQGAAVSLRVPADAAGLDMPAPPIDQRVFESVSLQAHGERGATLRLQVAEGARFDLARSAQGLTLRGRLPAPPQAATDAEAAPSGSRPTIAAEEPQATAAEEETAAQADQTDQTAAASSEGDPTPSEANATTADTAGPVEGQSAQAANETRSASANDEGVSADDSGAAGNGATGTMQKEDRSPPAVRAERRYGEARSAVAAGDLRQARQRLRDALELDPGLHPARDLLAALHRRAGQGDAARDVLAEGVEQVPRRVAYAKPYARLLVDAGDLERAAQVLSDAARAAGDDAEFHALTAAVAQRRGRHEAAASAYTRALELEAGNSRWWLGLGVSLAASGHPGEAVAAFREARRAGSLTPRLDAWVRGRIQALEGGSG